MRGIGLGDLTRAVNHVRRQESDAKQRLINNLNEPIYCLKYGSFDDYVDFVIRNSNMNRYNAERFVKFNTKKFNKTK